MLILNLGAPSAFPGNREQERQDALNPFFTIHSSPLISLHLYFSIPVSFLTNLTYEPNMNSIRLVYLWEQRQLREQATTKDFFLVVRQEGKRAMSSRAMSSPPM